MAETHVQITVDKSGNAVQFHNPAQHPLAPNAGVPAVPTPKTPGFPNGNVHGSTNVGAVVPGPVVNNPA